MIKKTGKILGIIVVLLFLVLLILPYAFKEKINKIAKEQINQNVNAVVNFDDLSISLLRSFPDVSVDLQGLSIVNREPFLGDTLADVGHIYVDVSLNSLLGDTPKINSVRLADVYADIKVNKDSVANYDIAFPSEEKEVVEPTESSAPFSVAITDYELENIHVKYVDEVSNMTALVVNFNHSGNGDLSQNILELDTHTNADAITFIMDDVAYLKDLHLKYDAKVGVDYDENLKLNFKDNAIQINDLYLTFDGAFEMLKEGYDVDFNLETRGAKFKSLLSLIPNAYTESFSEVATTGALDLHGVVKGTYSDTTIPTMDIVLKTENSSLKYPDLPNTIEAINLDTHIVNTTGNLDDLKVDIHNFGFQVVDDIFKASATITKPVSNLTVSSILDGKVDLGNLKNAYPIPELEYELKGIVNAEISASFDMNSIEKEQYDRVDSKGTITISGMSVSSEYTPKPLIVESAKMLFSLNHVEVVDTKIMSGNSDLLLNGGLDHVYDYAFSDGTLDGKLDIVSTLFNVGDFYETDTTLVVTQETDSVPATVEQFKIPEKIEFIGTVAVKKVMYDDIVLNNFTGKTEVKEQQITFTNTSANMFSGSVAIDGFLNTKPHPSVYDFDMKLKQVDIESAFNSMDMLKKIAPILGAFNGRFDTDLDIKGALGDDLMPVLSMLSGGAFANLQVDEVDVSKNKFLSLAENKLDFLDFDKINLEDLKADVSFENSSVNVSPFVVNFKGIPVTIGGSHSFENNMSYDLTLDLPAKYLGKEAENILGSLNNEDSITVPMAVKVGGTITKPTVVPDIKNAVASLTTSILENEKSKAKEKIKSEAKKGINKLLGIESSKDDKENGNDLKEAGKSLLKGLFGK